MPYYPPPGSGSEEGEWQPLDEQLTALAALAYAANSVVQSTASGLRMRTPADLKLDLGLNLVDNTSDANKPVSTAQQTALDLKANTANAKGFVNHGATASTARPSGYASVEWMGSVEPTNAINGDTWVVTP